MRKIIPIWQLDYELENLLHYYNKRMFFKKL